MREKLVTSSGAPVKERNVGIDLLRLISMFMVVILHALLASDLLTDAEGSSFAVAWLMEVISFGAVDIFAIISGYVGFSNTEKPYRYSRYVSLWLQVFFYSFGLAFLGLILHVPGFDFRGLKGFALPVSSSLYWYFTAYTPLFFMIPFINAMLRSFDRNRTILLVLFIFFFFSCLRTFSLWQFESALTVKTGYSFVWLLLLYIIGAWMKKCDIPQKVSSGPALIVLAVCVAATWFVRVILGSELLVDYMSPTMVLISVSLLILFARMRFHAFLKKTILFCAPAAFGIYILHLHSFVWNHVSPFFVRAAALPTGKMVLCILGGAFAEWLLCLAVDLLRIQLFKLIRIDLFSEWVCRCVSRLIGKIFSKLGIKD